MIAAVVALAVALERARARGRAASASGAIAFLEGGAVEMRGDVVTRDLVCQRGDAPAAFATCKGLRLVTGLDALLAGGAAVSVVLVWACSSGRGCGRLGACRSLPRS